MKRGLFSKGMSYTSELVYNKPNCPPEKNSAAIEGTIQTLNRENEQVLKQLREREKQGKLQPLLIQHSP